MGGEKRRKRQILGISLGDNMDFKPSTDRITEHLKLKKYPKKFLGQPNIPRGPQESQSRGF